MPATIRKVTEPDLRAVADVHCTAFTDSALTGLGHEAVRRYYEWLLTGPHDAFCFGAFQEDDMLGFCFGGIFHGALSGFVRKNRQFLIRLVVTHPWLLTNPIFRERLMLGLRALHRAPPATVPAESLWHSFGVLAIAVHPASQGYGVGRLLMTKLEDFAVERGYRQMHLSVHPKNTQAVRFYESLGWRRILLDSIWKGRMEKSIGKPS